MPRPGIAIAHYFRTRQAFRCCCRETQKFAELETRKDSALAYKIFYSSAPYTVLLLEHILSPDKLNSDKSLTKFKRALKYADQ
jgi:hypothetical protein